MRRDRTPQRRLARGRAIRYDPLDAAAFFRGRTTVARDLDGARRNAAAIAKEEVRSQGPPRRATVIRASRTLPETFSKNTKPRYSRQYGALMLI